MKRTVLIVDDMTIFREPIAAILRAADYDVVCACDGRDALAAARKSRPDIILLDAAMPNMDGISCLRELRNDAALKNVPVIMLTAVSERDIVLAAARLGVQGYLLKSQFSTEDLLIRVSRCISDPKPPASSQPQTPAASNLPIEERPACAPLHRTEVLQRVRCDLELRSIPPVLEQVMMLTSTSTSSVEEVAAAVRQDQALALRVMKAANSSLYGLGKRSNNLTDAAQRIGMAGIRNAAAAIAAIDHFADTPVCGLLPQRFWEHGLATAVLAQMLAQAVRSARAEELFLAGMMHDLGRLVLCGVYPEHYGCVLAPGADVSRELHMRERQVFGLDHTEITREVLGRWQLPELIIEAAALHHLGVDQIRRSARDAQSALIVSLANRLAHALAIGNSGDATLIPYDEFVRALNLETTALTNLTKEAAERASDITCFYASKGHDGFRGPFFAELEQQIKAPARVTVLSYTAPADAASLFLGQMRMIDDVRPEAAIVVCEGASDPQRCLAKWQARRAEYGYEIPALLLFRSEVPDEIKGQIEMLMPQPVSYSELLKAVSRLAQQKPAQVAAQQVG